MHLILWHALQFPVAERTLADKKKHCQFTPMSTSSQKTERWMRTQPCLLSNPVALRTPSRRRSLVPLIYFLSFFLRKSLIYFQYVIPLTLVIICNLLNSMFHFLSLPETPGSELVGIPTGIGYRKTRSKYTASTIGGAADACHLVVEASDALLPPPDRRLGSRRRRH